jgi:HSP20 family protein
MAENKLTPARDWWPGRRMSEWFDWLDWPATGGQQMIRVEEQRDDDKLTIRAEMPGIDPDKDVEVRVRNHAVEIRGERREESSSDEKGVRRSEFRYGSFFRVVPLPEGAKEGDVHASYKDGILEIDVPCTPAGDKSESRVPVERK